ncbi:MAG: glycerophosphodiester phosphodiesterase family protein [Hansschlegelia sp.]
MGALDWLFARPIAHRGLHDRAAGVIENTPTAVSRAIDAGYGVEIDVRETADGGAVIFHDKTLDRLTEETGPVIGRTVDELRRIPILGSPDRILTLDECLDLVSDRAPLVIEIKSPSGRDVDHARRVAETIAARGDRVALKSFNPHAIQIVRLYAPEVARGVIGEAFADDDPTWKHLGSRRRARARTLSHLRRTKPDFLSWDIEDIDRAEVAAFRASGKPVMSWTVKSPSDRERALRSADQIVFEGFLPDQNR